MAKNSGTSPTTTNSRDSSPQWAGVFAACDAAKPGLAVPPLRDAEAAGNTSDVDVEQQLLIESAGGDSLSDVSPPDVPLPDVPLPDVPLNEVYPDGSVGEK